MSIESFTHEINASNFIRALQMFDGNKAVLKELLAGMRRVMKLVGATEPSDPTSLIWKASKPNPDYMSDQSIMWHVRTEPKTDPVLRFWMFVEGLERGWFAHDRQCGFLVWTELGRTLREADETSGQGIDSKGQAFFAF